MDTQEILTSYLSISHIRDTTLNDNKCPYYYKRYFANTTANEGWLGHSNADKRDILVDFKNFLVLRESVKSEKLLKQLIAIENEYLSAKY